MRRTAYSLIVAAAVAGTSVPAVAHPMGNFSVSHYARFDIGPAGTEFTYVLDFAEIPTFELMQGWNLDGRDRDAVIRRAAAQAGGWISALRIEGDGKPVPPRILSAAAAVQDGAGGLAVLRVTIRAALPPAHAVQYEDRNYPTRAGWKEIVISARDGIVLESASQGAEDRSSELRSYPADPTAAPPQDVIASFRWSAPASIPFTGNAPPVPKRPSPHPAAIPEKAPPPTAASSPVPPAGPGQARPAGSVVRGDYLSKMLGGAAITPGILMIGLCAAFGLGAVHALSPGHGKTIVAAYLVGSRGTVKHAALLGATVTFTHTAAVFALGMGVLFFQRYVAPERIIPLLSAVSGVSIVVIGAALLYTRLRALTSGRQPHVHVHPHEHHHEHPHPHAHHHEHGHAHPHSHVPEGGFNLASLIALGVSGGLVPCPSALVLLLSATALGRAGVGIVLLVAFSAGLAIVLTAIGAAVLYARKLLPARSIPSGRALGYLPVFSAAVVTAIGLVMTGVSLGWIKPAGFLQ